MQVEIIEVSVAYYSLGWSIDAPHPYDLIPVTGL